MKLRCAIVDDELLARELLRAMLSEQPDVEIVGEYATGMDAVPGICEENPDVVFLDIQMPEMDGFDVVEALGRSGEMEDGRMPAFVFVTAYDRYALRAFEIHALDYLLKPYEAERLGVALERVRGARSNPDASGGNAQIVALLDTLRERERMHGWIAIREGERTYLQNVSDIEWVEADAKYMRIHTAERTYSMRETMRNLEGRLDPARFLRVSRSAIVNLHRVREIQPWFNGDFVLIMQSGAQVTTGRSHRGKLARLIGRR